MNWLWISGWAVPPEWLAAQAKTAWPRASHVAVAPMDAARALSRQKFDVLGGYSLGAMWLMRQAKAIPDDLPVVLLAPIFSFVAEHQRGGRVALAQLRLQRRRLRNDPAAAVTDFFQRAGLEELVNLPKAKPGHSRHPEELEEELSWLEDWSISAVPKNWRGYVGGRDPLLEAPELKKIWPELKIVARAGHAPGPLMNAAKKTFPKGAA